MDSTFTDGAFWQVAGEELAGGGGGHARIATVLVFVVGMRAGSLMLVCFSLICSFWWALRETMEIYHVTTAWEEANGSVRIGSS
jgi:hypothetical protein